VLELYAPQGAKDSAFDSPISDIAGKMDDKFRIQDGRNKIGDLRKIRNRIVHSLANGGHLDPHNVEDIKLVESNLADIKALATILIWGTSAPWRQ